MARILAAILFAVTGSISLSAGALGLGEIDLQSALNQPFNAEIPVVSEKPGDLESLHVEIASAQTFRQFGLDRAGFLSGFQFSVVAADGDGTAAVVRITSKQPVVEPFVTLLLEVSWAQGRLLREYTVLLDPPVFATEPAAPVASAPKTPATPSRATPDATPRVAPATSGGAKPVSPPASPMTAGGGQPQTAPPVERNQQPDQESDDGAIYGPVKRHDTLWAIAGNYADADSVSRNQMMLAIYQANPEAFAGNINRLKAGMILRVPSADEISLGSTEANSEVRRQNEQWRSARGKQPQGGRLRLVPPPDSDEEIAESATESVPETGSGETVSGDEQDRLQERVSELETQLADSQRQLQVRDRELEALQRQLAGLQNAQGNAVEADVESEAQDVAPFVDEPEPVADLTETETNVESPLPQIPEEEAVEPAVPVEVTPAEPERKDESFLGGLFKNPLVYISLVIVLLLAWLVARRRTERTESMETGRWDPAAAVEEEDFDDESHEATTRMRARPQPDETFVVEETPSSDETDEGSVVSFSDTPPEEWAGLAEEKETPLERTISTDSAVNLDQVDPIAESDFHMAYGLYDQAADLLTRSLDEKPDSRELRMKLLEVYFIWENREGFMKEASALKERIEDAADPDWNKVLIMGKQLCPDESLFSGDVGPVPSTESVDLEFDADGGSSGAIDFAFEGEDSAGANDQVDMEFDEESADLDFDLSGMDEDEQAESGTGLLDLDIGDEDEATHVTDDDEAKISGEAPTMETPTIESPVMDGETTMETPTIESPAMESTMETPTIESKIGQWDDGDHEQSNSADDQTAEIDLDDLDLDLDLADLDEEGVDEPDADIADESEPVNLSKDDTREQAVLSDDATDDVESTAEMQKLGGDTAEQPTIGGDTKEQPSLEKLANAADEDEAPGTSESIVDEDRSAGMEDFASGEASVEGATMTEVGTKLDLARAYIDMGDPDGARSILQEVMEEAGEGQRQEAQKLLEDLED